MTELIEANWILLVVALLVGVLVAWWIFVSSRRTKVELEERDETEPEARTKRNQALIDAPPAASVQGSPRSDASHSPEEAKRVVPPATPMGLAGAGEAVQTAAEPEPEAQPTELATDVAADGIGENSDEPAPLPEQQPQPEPVAPAGEDDLTRIKGLGAKIPMGTRAEIVRGLTEALHALAADPAALPRQAAAARALVLDHFTWSRKARQVRTIYDWVRAPQGPAPAPLQRPATP